MKITYTRIGSHSSSYLCSYCNKIILSKDDIDCHKNVIYKKHITIIPSFNELTNCLLQTFGTNYYKKIN